MEAQSPMERTAISPESAGRSQRLKEATTSIHERLDDAVMRRQPFSSIENYRLFLLVQHAFHRHVEALYRSPAVSRLFPMIAGRSRVQFIELDLADLDVSRPDYAQRPQFDGEVALPTALGWLYVAEGAKLGAAFLLKHARLIGLSEDFGARHLAAAEAGRASEWRAFRAGLDAAELPADSEADVISGANAAFANVRAALARVYGAGETGAPSRGVLGSIQPRGWT